MTDNEIIKALECCSIDNHIGVCKECHFADVCDEDEQALQKHALDLINRQKAEIERLEKALEEAISCFNRIESLYKIKCKELEVAKSEAIKEFSERLKEYAKELQIGDNISWLILGVGRVDQLVKEMTEGKNE